MYRRLQLFTTLIPYIFVKQIHNNTPFQIIYISFLFRSISQSVYISLYNPIFLCLSISLFISISLTLFHSLSIFLFLSLSFYLPLSVSLFLTPSLSVFLSIFFLFLFFSPYFISLSSSPCVAFYIYISLSFLTLLLSLCLSCLCGFLSHFLSISLCFFLILPRFLYLFQYLSPLLISERHKIYKENNIAVQKVLLCDLSDNWLEKISTQYTPFSPSQLYDLDHLIVLYHSLALSLRISCYKIRVVFLEQR